MLFMTKNLEQLISTKRLEGYKGKSNNKLETQLLRYSYNIDLCSTFYAPLHLLEIALRNTLSIELQNYLNDPDCLKNYKSHNIFQSREKDKIQEAIDELTKKRKPLEMGRIIAELNFGFWVNLYDKPYMTFQIRTIKSQFPSATKGQRNIFSIKTKLNSIRLLRNRIFHYEPIWHWTNLDAHFCDIKEILLWMNNDLYLKSFEDSEKEFDDLFDRQPTLLK